MQPDRDARTGGPFAHIAVPYASEDESLPVVITTIQKAVSAGHRILLSTGQRFHDLVADALGADMDRVDHRAAQEWYLHPYRTLSATHDYCRSHDGHILVVGEPLWQGRGERETREWIRYESVINALFGGESVTTMCLYDRRTTPFQVLAHIPRTHPGYLTGQSVHGSNAYVPPDRLTLYGDDLPLSEPPAPPVAAEFSPGDLGRLRQTVTDYALRAGMARDQIVSLVMSVSEIAANSVEHGAGHGGIAMWTTGQEVVCEITDPGGTIDVPLPGYLPPEPEAEGGYGLWISRQLCDLVEIRAHGGVLRVRLHMRLV
ncbi:Anti-sigma regulatory factor (Ser/Thr protein kinase) [Sinosporangium album]|uniref:Anti-sigma regulatory factor (Ser/Thr protein kinase) n=1 Tax=Sinosporangium album TaxID=504805 RepID=A0A1G8B2I1_9ACTN|nr:sensor histidine kinase [Sinosporangium album]SDH27325.1 Anti-sigma regulatory factor (Ser/Thr protein kinase) [Sinosporangium album]